MEYAEEKRFIRSFIKKNRRERLLHELTTPKKRRAGIMRFCHTAEDLLDPSKIRMKGGDLERRPEFREFVRSHDGECRVFSDDLWLDGYLPLEQAVAEAAFCAGAVLILGDGFAVVFTEAVQGGRDRYLLCEKESEI